MDRLTAHFGETPDGTEIMRDIESRIAEKFIDAKHKLVTDRDVNAVIAEIGDASALTDEADAKTTSTPPLDVPARKRLYRDIDTAYIGGVASGIAAYFNIDPLWIRGAFLLSIFTGGAGIVLYIVLWLLIPEAKSASQKLEMNGRPVNLDTIASVVKERFDEVEKSGALRRGAYAIDSIVRRVLSIIGRIVGVFLTFGSFFAIIGASLAMGIILLNWNAPWNDIPHKEIISPALLWSAVIAGYAAIVIPLVFIFTLGFRWMTKHSLLTATLGFGLIGVWTLSLVSGGVIATKIGGDYFAYTASSPEYARVIENPEVAPFTAVSIERTHVTIVQGEAFGVRVEGRQMDMQNVSVQSDNGVLTVSSVPRKESPCLFCHTRTPSVTITGPDIEALNV
ncbi:MAG: PspC domain-containing protein, partial [Acidobacteriota bacterium]